MKKYAIVFLSLFLVISLPFAAHANIVTATGRYIINAVKHAPSAAKVTATNTATGAKHVIKHGVSSADLGKGIGAGVVTFAVGSGVGLAFQAITGLALDAVDWVMDPANNQLKWKKKGEGGAGGTGLEYPWIMPSFGIGGTTPEDACLFYYSTRAPLIYHSIKAYGSDNFGCFHTNPTSSKPDTVSLSEYVTRNKSYIDDGSSIEKSLPLDTLAAKVIEQADGGNVDSQKTIEDYVTNLAKEGKLDNELDNSTDITKPDGTEPDDPTKPDDKECPVGTVLVGEVCVEKSETDTSLWCDSTDFSKKICDWIDWTQVKHDEPEPDAGKVDIIDKSEDLNIDRDRIDFSNQCPAPTPINTSVGGFPVSTELNYQPLCDFFTMLNPFVIGMGGISSALIIAGGVRRG